MLNHRGPATHQQMMSADLTRSDVRSLFASSTRISANSTCRRLTNSVARSLTVRTMMEVLEIRGNSWRINRAW